MKSINKNKSISKKVLIINGTEREDGNTDIIVNKIIEGSNGTGIDITIFDLKKKKIAGCIGCYNCYMEAKCSIKDDMYNIHEKIQKADLIIFASPLYWWGVTGLMKTFIDRLYLYYPQQNRGLIAGKKAIVITPMTVPDAADESKILVEFYKRLFNRLKFKIIDMIYFCGIMKKGAVTSKTEYLEKAFSLGENLSELIESEDL